MRKIDYLCNVFDAAKTMVRNMFYNIYKYSAGAASLVGYFFMKGTEYE